MQLTSYVVYLLTFLIFVGILIGEHDGLPTGSHWLTYLYASVLLAVCLVVCLTGSTMFARISIVILCVSLSAKRKSILHDYSSTRQSWAPAGGSKGERSLPPGKFEKKKKKKFEKKCTNKIF